MSDTTPQILIVEDEERIADFVAKGLRRREVSTAIAGSGKAAFELLQRQVFDVVLLDLGLPDMTGWDIIAELRNQSNDIPIIVVTALTDEENVDRARSLGVSAYIKKPFRFDALFQAIQECLPQD